MTQQAFQARIPEGKGASAEGGNCAGSAQRDVPIDGCHGGYRLVESHRLLFVGLSCSLSHLQTNKRSPKEEVYV